MNGISHNFDDLKIKALEADIAHQKAILPLMIEFQAVHAQITRAKFNELVKAEFTRHEALMLCK